MKKMKCFKIFIGIAMFGLSLSVEAFDKPGMQRSLLMENKIVLPTNLIEAKTMRVVFPPFFKTPWHTHEGPGPRYVVKGELKVSEGSKTETYKTGDVFWETGKLMAVENIGADTAELIIFELAPVKK
jgi:quercetin dioxygenase-like cupin family protein